MVLMRSSRSDALNNKNSNSIWTQAEERLVPECWPAIKAGFTVPSGSKIYTIGSCFARNIESQLSLLGFDIPTLEYEGTRREYPYRENGILNKYTPASIWQDFQWHQKVLTDGGIVNFDNCSDLFIETADGFIDMQLSGFVPVTRERFIARRQQIFELVGTAFDADCVTITLGLIEAWYDSETGLYIQSPPFGRHFQNMAGRFEFHVLTFSESYDYISSTIELLQRQGRGKILLTTSPVPMQRTFTDQDVITANMFSKSLLRTVCGEIVAKYEDVDYFPGFETVQGTRNWDVFIEDRIHVSPNLVGRIVSALAENYFHLDRENIALQRAEILASEIAWPAAFDALSEVGEFRKDQPRIIAALIYGNNDRQQLAAELLGKVDVPSLQPRLWPQYVDAMLAAGMIEEALEFSKNRIRHPRADAMLTFHYGRALIQAGQRSDARACLEELIKAKPTALGVLKLLAELAAGDGDLVSCRKWIEQARKLYPHTNKFDAIELQIAT